MKKTITLILMLFVCGVSMLHFKPVSADSTKDALQKAVDNAVANGLPGVSLAIDSPDSGLITVVSGYSDLGARMAITPTDISRIASVSKVYIATVIMQLVEEGKISVDDQVGKYLNADDVQHIANASKATIAQVLTHSSGIVDYFNDASFGADQPDKLDFTLEEVLHYIWDMPANFAPGDHYAYSDTNTVLLAMVIEKVTGQDFAQAVRTRILTPLHLEHTYTEIFEPVPVSIVHGYAFNKPDSPVDLIKMQGAGLPDGGIVTTPEDMVKFMRGLLVDGKLLKSATVADMITPRLDTGDSESIGYHLFMRGNENHRLYFHDGYIDGYQAWLSHNMASGVTVAVWANGTGQDQDKAFNALVDEAQALFGKDQ